MLYDRNYAILSSTRNYPRAKMVVRTTLQHSYGDLMISSPTITSRASLIKQNNTNIVRGVKFNVVMLMFVYTSSHPHVQNVRTCGASVKNPLEANGDLTKSGFAPDFVRSKSRWKPTAT